LSWAKESNSARGIRKALFRPWPIVSAAKRTNYHLWKTCPFKWLQWKRISLQHLS